MGSIPTRSPASSNLFLEQEEEEGGPGLEKGNTDESNEEGEGWKAIGSTRGHEGSPGSSDILMEART